MNAFRWLQLYALCFLTVGNAVGFLTWVLIPGEFWRSLSSLIGVAASVYLWAKYKNVLWSWGEIPHEG